MTLKEDLKERVKALVDDKSTAAIVVKEVYLAQMLSTVKSFRKLPIFVVQDFDEIKYFSEEQMKKFGWVKDKPKSKIITL